MGSEISLAWGGGLWNYFGVGWWALELLWRGVWALELLWRGVMGSGITLAWGGGMGLWNYFDSKETTMPIYFVKKVNIKFECFKLPYIN